MPLDAIKARTAARRAAGIDQTYPEHAGAAPAPAPRAPLPVIRPACAHLGARLPGQPCGSPLLRCDLHGDVTTRLTPCAGAQRCCAACPDHATGTAPLG